MSVLDVVQRMHVYNRWADEQLLKAADGLDGEDLVAEAPVAEGTLGGAIGHLVGAQIAWLGICAGPEAIGRLTVGDVTSITGLGEMFRASHDGWAGFLESVSEERLNGNLEMPIDHGFRMSAGEPLLKWAEEHGRRPPRPLWAGVLHVVNHSTQHRGEIGMHLNSLGRSPGDLDYGTFEEYRAIGLMPDRLESELG